MTGWLAVAVAGERVGHTFGIYVEKCLSMSMRQNISPFRLCLRALPSFTTVRKILFWSNLHGFTARQKMDKYFFITIITTWNKTHGWLSCNNNLNEIRFQILLGCVDNKIRPGEIHMSMGKPTRWPENRNKWLKMLNKISKKKKRTDTVPFNNSLFSSAVQTAEISCLSLSLIIRIFF